MATHTEPATSAAPAARDLWPYPTDYTLWKVLGWAGPAFLFLFVSLWGFLGRNMPPFSPNATPDEVKAHFSELRLPLLIGMSVALTITAFYMAWSVAIARVMERVEGPGGVLSKLEMMGGTITCAPIMVACAMWLTADELRACADRHRSPAVLECLDHYLAGRRVPLDFIHTHSVAPVRVQDLNSASGK